ncbi:MAG: Hsp70 family protein [bacterium]|nr:Hsp70 family protein [bacterium]
MATETTLNNFIPALSNTSMVRDKLKNTTFIGIDFGTSTTVASYAVLGDNKTPIRTETIPIEQIMHDGRHFESHLVPSIIAWYKDKLLIGEGARFVKYGMTPNKNVWSSFKMKLGINLGPMYYNTDLPSNHPIATIENPSQAATVFFKFIKQGVEKFVKKKKLPGHIEYSISIPASFESNQRADLLKALKDAGIELSTYCFIDEPNAAFLSYLAESNQNNLGSFQIAENSPIHILVFDFGAGTCDLSLLEIGRTHKSFYSKNIAISRYEEMGGDDIDYLIAKNLLLNRLLEESNLQLDDLSTADLNKRIIPKLLKPAEDLKIKVSKTIANQIIGYELPPIAKSETEVKLGYDVEIALPRQTLILSKPSIMYQDFYQINDLLFDGYSEELSEGLKEGKCVNSLLDDILSKSNLPASDIDMVLLIGGSSANPYLQKN